MTVHSTQLGHGTAITTAGSVIYTVPAGKRAIVKSVALLNLYAGTNRVLVNFTLAAGGSVYLATTLGAFASATESIQLNTWVVLNPGDKIEIDPGSGNVTAIASGAELTL